MAGFKNFSKLKNGATFTINGEHFVKIDRLWYQSIENRSLGQMMMDVTTDAKINVGGEGTPAKPMVDCSAKIVDVNNNLVKPPSSQQMAKDFREARQRKTAKKAPAKKAKKTAKRKR